MNISSVILNKETLESIRNSKGDVTLRVQSCDVRGSQIISVISKEGNKDKVVSVVNVLWDEV
jgi:hypothetical protein